MCRYYDSNDTWDAIIIKAKIKRQMKEIFRRNGQIRNFVIFTFSAGLAILLERNFKIQTILVDREYFGKEAIIKNIVLGMLSKMKDTPNLYFDFIGRDSSAHLLAKEVARGKKKAHHIVNIDELLNKIKMTEVGKRLKDA